MIDLYGYDSFAEQPFMQESDVCESRVNVATSPLNHDDDHSSTA